MPDSLVQTGLDEDSLATCQPVKSGRPFQAAKLLVEGIGMV